MRAYQCDKCKVFASEEACGGWGGAYIQEPSAVASGMSFNITRTLDETRLQLCGPCLRAVKDFAAERPATAG